MPRLRVALSSTVAPDLVEALGPPLALTFVGVEHEYTVRDGPRLLDFRRLITHLPIDGRRVDPRDWWAYRCTWGGVITCDGAEAEIACPPVPLAAGFDRDCVAWGERGEAALRAALPDHLTMVPFSTHISVSAANPRSIAERLAHTAAIAMVGDMCGVIVRARPGRVELCFEPVHGDALAKMVRFVAGAAAALERDIDALGPPLDIRTEPGIERPGWYIDRKRSLGKLDDFPRYERLAALGKLPRRNPQTPWTSVLRPDLLSVTWDAAVFDIGGGVAAIPAPWLGRYLAMSEAGELDDVLTRAPRSGRLESWSQLSAPGTYSALGDSVGLITPELDGPMIATGTGKSRPPGQATLSTRGRFPWWIPVAAVLVLIGILIWSMRGGDDTTATTATTPTKSSTTTSTVVVGASPRDIAIISTFQQSIYSTFYDASAVDPDGDSLTYDWDLRFAAGQEDCGVFTHDGERAQWQHPHESQRGLVPGFPDDRYCSDTQASGRHEGTVVVSISDRASECFAVWDRGSQVGELRGLPCG